MSAETEARPLYLNGEWVVTTDSLAVTNPSTGEMVGRVGTVGRERVREALADAERAWTGWRSLSAKERGTYLAKIAAGVQSRSEEFAKIITLENGKPLPQSRGEIGMTVDHLEWYAGEARRSYGRVVPQIVSGKRHVVVKTPIGVVGAIAPWNFPLVLAVRKIAPALAAGCPTILKPASATPLSAILFAEVVHEAGIPRGVFQVVAGTASQIAAEMLENPACRKISFTGSTEVGRELVRGAADNLTKLSLELGGNAPVLVFEDADIDRAVEGALITKFRNTGQSCIAANRIYVHRSIYESFKEKLIERTQALKIGDGFEEGVEIGPLIDEVSLEKGLEAIEDAKSKGAEVLCGGRRWSGSDKGYFLEPTLLENVSDEATVMCSEIFAPIAPLVPFNTEGEVIERANSTEYGLAAYAFTEDVSRVWRLAESLEAGTIGINDPVPAASHAPFGGLKQSGWGRELGIEGMDAYLETKHVSLGISE